MCEFTPRSAGSMILASHGLVHSHLWQLIIYNGEADASDHRSGKSANFVGRIVSTLLASTPGDASYGEGTKYLIFCTLSRIQRSVHLSADADC
jgi:hypothetical protein